MTRFDEIKARVAAYDSLTTDSDTWPTAGEEEHIQVAYWNTLSEDFRWCIGELAKFVECDEPSSCYIAGSEGSDMCIIYHKVGE